MAISAHVSLPRGGHLATELACALSLLTRETNAHLPAPVYPFSSFSLSLVFKFSLFSLSFVIVRERAPESHSAGSVCHLLRWRPWCAMEGIRRSARWRWTLRTRADWMEACSERTSHLSRVRILLIFLITSPEATNTGPGFNWRSGGGRLGVRYQRMGRGICAYIGGGAVGGGGG